MLGIPPSNDWVAYCVDEALHLLERGHERRDYQWAERFRRDPDDGDDLYRSIMSDPRTGKPPSAKELGMLAAAQQHG